MDFKGLGHIYWAIKRVIRYGYKLTATRFNIQNAADDPSIKIYQIYYDPKTQQRLDPQFTPYKNNQCTKYFADSVIVNLHHDNHMRDCEYFGVVSWRIWEKLFNREDIRGFIREQEPHHYDFFYFSGRILKPERSKLWRQGNFLHRTDLTSYTQKLMSELGFDCDLLNLEVAPSYFSYHICRTDLYCEYVEKFLIPMMEKMEDSYRHDLQDWLNQDAHYSRYGDTVEAERLRQITGHPFLYQACFYY